MKGFSVRSLSKKSFAQLAAVWNVGVTPELRRLDSSVVWPTLNTPEDVNTDAFKSISHTFHLASQDAIRKAETFRNINYSIRLECYIEERLERLSRHLDKLMKLHGGSLKLYIDSRRVLYNDRTILVSALEASLPSPRTQKRRPKISPRSETGQSLRLLRYELFAVQEKIDILDEAIAKLSSAATSIVNLVIGARDTLTRRFVLEEEKRERDFRSLQLRCDKLEIVVSNMVAVLKMNTKVI